MVVVLVAMTGATLIQRYLLSWAAVTLDGTTLDFLTDRMLALPMSYFHSRRTGDIQRRLAGLRQVRAFMVQDGVEGLTAAATVLAAVTLMFVYDWLLALVFLATAPAYAWLMRFSRKRLRPMFDSLEEAFGQLPLPPDRRDQGDRDGQGGRRRAGLPDADARPVHEPRAAAVPRGLHDHVLRGRDPVVSFASLDRSSSSSERSACSTAP